MDWAGSSLKPGPRSVMTVGNYQYRSNPDIVGSCNRNMAEVVVVKECSAKCIKYETGFLSRVVLRISKWAWNSSANLISGQVVREKRKM